MYLQEWNSLENPNIACDTYATRFYMYSTISTKHNLQFNYTNTTYNYTNIAHNLLLLYTNYWFIRYFKAYW